MSPTHAQVDDLEDTSKLEIYVRQTQCMLLCIGTRAHRTSTDSPPHPSAFLSNADPPLTSRPSAASPVFSEGYFHSPACRVEVLSALKHCKPLVIVHEADPKHGGKSLSALEGEFCEKPTRLPQSLKDALEGSGELHAVGMMKPREMLFSISPSCEPGVDANGQRQGLPIISWLRVADFQLLSLELIATGILRAQSATQLTMSRRRGSAGTCLSEFSSETKGTSRASRGSRSSRSRLNPTPAAFDHLMMSSRPASADL